LLLLHIIQCLVIRKWVIDLDSLAQLVAVNVKKGYVILNF